MEAGTNLDVSGHSSFFSPLKNTVKLMIRVSRLWYLQGSRCQSARLVQDGVLGVWLVRSIPVDVSPFFDATCK